MTQGEGLSWDDLRYVEAVDRLGTAGRAARELGVSASTVYRRIAVLEQRVGTRCILPGSGTGRLTDTGRALAAIARQTDASIVALARDVKAARQRVAGEVSLTTVEGFVPFLAPALAALSARHPDLVVRVHIGEQGPSVRRREVDVAIGVMLKPAESLRGKKLFSIEYGVYATKACAKRAPLPWSVLASPLDRTPQGDWEAEQAERVVARTASLAMTIATCRAGMAAAVLPRRVAVLHPELVEVSKHRASLASIARVAWLLTHPDVADEPRVRALLDAMTEALSQI